MSVKISTSRILQALTGLCDLVNLLSPMIPAQYKEVVGAVLVIIHFGINEIAHRSTPSGGVSPK